MKKLHSTINRAYTAHQASFTEALDAVSARTLVAQPSRPHNYIYSGCQVMWGRSSLRNANHRSPECGSLGAFVIGRAYRNDGSFT